MLTLPLLLRKELILFDGHLKGVFSQSFLKDITNEQVVQDDDEGTKKRKKKKNDNAIVVGGGGMVPLPESMELLMHFSPTLTPTD